MKRGDGRGNLWSIVLAGGDGMRTREFIRRWLGYEKSKQYCAFVGSRSMFQHTLDRAARLTPWERVVVVAARHHQHEVWPQLDGRPAGMVLLQPKNLDTGAGIFLPLTYILARDPQAIVVIYPSDHFIHREDPFLSAVDHAVWGSNRLGGRPVLLAAKPDSLELEYGWIKPGRSLGRIGKAPIQAVETFFEKPDEVTARGAKAAGGLWNTMVLAARGRDLWDLGWKCFPEMMHRFDRLKDAIDTAEELRVLDAIYDAMPRRNFSSHLLHCAPDRLAVMEMRDVLWSDWGNPERILSGIEKIGKRPAFSVEQVRSPFGCDDQQLRVPGSLPVRDDEQIVTR
ncbi:MAG: sugar phosphate nucleotidyltransferase [Nitrospiraceae bacterium]